MGICAGEYALGVRAAELGVQGVETDFHRTLDGVIVVFHDDTLERLLDGIGRIDQHYYEELLLYTFNGLPAPAATTERVQTLRDFLQHLRNHALLVYLDIKVPGIDREMLEALQKADMLDQVAGYSDYNSPAFREAKVATVPGKGSLMGHDTDPQEARAVLKQPGNMLMMDDPRPPGGPRQAARADRAAALGAVGRGGTAIVGRAGGGPAQHHEPNAGAAGRRPHGDLRSPSLYRDRRRTVPVVQRRDPAGHGLEPGNDCQTSPGPGFRAGSRRPLAAAWRCRR